jgi:hypothetical protein
MQNKTITEEGNPPRPPEYPTRRVEDLGFIWCEILAVPVLLFAWCILFVICMAIVDKM